MGSCINQKTPGPDEKRTQLMHHQRLSFEFHMKCIRNKTRVETNKLLAVIGDDIKIEQRFAHVHSTKNMAVNNLLSLQAILTSCNRMLTTMFVASASVCLCSRFPQGPFI